ncbi:MAG: fibrillarin-like rRNA/tRNA 2'-O-methyltransferase [Methanosarcinales archaeon]|nr:fibrillarin-like rRNA/tRNA 2'-O-methyltransferase [Methanosarcinales archaeon]
MYIEGLERIATRCAAPGAVYGERIIGGYRIWDPTRSKLAALILKSLHREGSPALDMLRLPPRSRVLYLGAATGTTVSHVSDMFSGGLVYAVEMSSRAMRDLLVLCQARSNIIPLLENAALPESYSRLVEPVDLIYQDVAQRNQADIALRNAQFYLRPGGILILMIKAMSIDSSSSADDVCDAEVARLCGLEVVQETDLQPYHRDHRAVVARKPGPA